MKTTIFITISATILFVSCKKEENKNIITNPPINNPQEQITTILLTGYNQDNPNNIAQQFSVKWEDLDGSGGNAPTIDSLLLDTGVTYRTTVIILDKTKTPWDTISNEVQNEKDVHQLFYTPSASLVGKLIVDRLDFDNNVPPLPLGLEVNLKALSTPSFVLPALGSLNIILSHYDGVPKTSVPSAESDFDINFGVRLK